LLATASFQPEGAEGLSGSGFQTRPNTVYELVFCLKLMTLGLCLGDEGCLWLDRAATQWPTVFRWSDALGHARKAKPCCTTCKPACDTSHESAGQRLGPTGCAAGVTDVGFLQPQD